MIIEVLLVATSIVGCAGCWAAVQKHRISAELQKHKLDHDLEVLKPPPMPKIAPPPETPAQQSLTALLERRESLETHITELRKCVCDYHEERFAQYRTDALQALEDAREEQKELVLEETGLLEMMHDLNKTMSSGKRVADPIVEAFLEREEASENKKEIGE